jgi:hypothetical protein
VRQRVFRQKQWPQGDGPTLAVGPPIAPAAAALNTSSRARPCARGGTRSADSGRILGGSTGRPPAAAAGDDRPAQTVRPRRNRVRHEPAQPKRRLPDAPRWHDTADSVTCSGYWGLRRVSRGARHGGTRHHSGLRRFQATFGRRWYSTDRTAPPWSPATKRLRRGMHRWLGNGDGSDFCCGAFHGRDWNSLPSPIIRCG